MGDCRVAAVGWDWERAIGRARPAVWATATAQQSAATRARPAPARRPRCRPRGVPAGGVRRGNGGMRGISHSGEPSLSMQPHFLTHLASRNSIRAGDRLRTRRPRPGCPTPVLPASSRQVRRRAVRHGTAPPPAASCLPLAAISGGRCMASDLREYVSRRGYGAHGRNCGHASCRRLIPRRRRLDLRRVPVMCAQTSARVRAPLGGTVYPACDGCGDVLWDAARVEWEGERGQYARQRGQQAEWYP